MQNINLKILVSEFYFLFFEVWKSEKQQQNMQYALDKNYCCKSKNQIFNFEN